MKPLDLKSATISSIDRRDSPSESSCRSARRPTREALIAALEEIARAARVIARKKPGFNHSFRMPKWPGNAIRDAI
jgi:hypothetical protein